MNTDQVLAYSKLIFAALPLLIDAAMKIEPLLARGLAVLNGSPVTQADFDELHELMAKSSAIIQAKIPGEDA